MTIGKDVPSLLQGEYSYRVTLISAGKYKKNLPLLGQRKKRLILHSIDLFHYK